MFRKFYSDSKKYESSHLTSLLAGSLTIVETSAYRWYGTIKKGIKFKVFSNSKCQQLSEKSSVTSINIEEYQIIYHRIAWENLWGTLRFYLRSLPISPIRLTHSYLRDSIKIQ